jgi:hypothetical protein
MLSHRIEIPCRNPHKFVDVGNMLLVWLSGQEGFEEPMAVVNLNDLPNLCQRRNAFAHNWRLPSAIIDLLNGDRSGGTRVDDTLIQSNGGEGTPFAEHGPVLLDQGNNLCSISR